MTITDILRESKNIVFFGGAGVSTESNIPDFRSPTGLYGKKKERSYLYPAETMLSRTFFDHYPKQFYEFYFNEMIYQDAMPNDAHKALVELEKMGKLKAIVTQNIDGLHQKAGSQTVYELHGSVLRNYCQRCGAFYDLNQTIASRDGNGIPRCSKDGAIIKPDVVLYEEGLDNNILMNAVEAISHADCLIVGGTSLVVYPAAGLIDYFHGKYLVLINRDQTSKDHYANLVIHDSIGKVLKDAVDQLQVQ